MISIFDRVENIVGKGENDGYQCFQKASRSRLSRVWIMRERVKWTKMLLEKQKMLRLKPFSMQVD